MSGDQKPARTVTNISQQELGLHASSVRSTTQLCGVRIPPIPPRAHLPVVLSLPIYPLVTPTGM